MANVLKPKRRTADATAPTTSNLADGEIATNVFSRTIYQRDGGSIVPIANFGLVAGEAFLDVYDSTVTYYNGSGGANNIDVNTLTAGTKVLVQTSGGNSNYPSGSIAINFYYIETIRAFTGTSKIQRAWGYNSSGRDSFAYRNYNGTTWSSWTYGWDTNTTRFQADFNNATLGSRGHFQTASANQNTVVGAIPNGTGTVSAFRTNNTSDPANAGYIEMRSLPGSVGFNSGNVGTGTLLDISFQFNSVEKASLASTGEFTAAILTAQGSTAGAVLWDRSNPTQRWIMYSTANIARLYWAATAADKFTWDSSGNFAADGGITMDAGLAVGYKNLVSQANSFVVGRLNKMTAGATLNTGNAADSTYYLYNNSGAAITITAGAGLTLRLSGTATTGNRTFAARGMAMIYCLSTTEYIISGDVT